MPTRNTPASKAPARTQSAQAVTRSAAKRAPKPVPKPAAQAVPRPAAAATAKPGPSKPPKLAMVRDSFTMPQSDYALIASLKKRAISFQRPVKKSELLRAGLQALAGQVDTKLKAALDSLAAIKTGRPKKR